VYRRPAQLTVIAIRDFELGSLKVSSGKTLQLRYNLARACISRGEVAIVPQNSEKGRKRKVVIPTIKERTRERPVTGGQCNGITNSGNRCKRDGSGVVNGYCHLHRDQNSEG
jgi:hypothetical protein